jgi:hypothetical protein
MSDEPERTVAPGRGLRHLLSIMPLSSLIYAVDHRKEFRYSVLTGQSGAAARAHYSGYIHTWIIIQSLLLGVDLGAIGLVQRDSQMLIDQLATLMFGLSAVMFLNSIAFMAVLALNFSACSAANFTAFGFIVDSGIWWAETILQAGFYPCYMSCPLVTISVMADPASLPAGIPWLHNGKVLVGVFVGLQAFLLVGTIYHINTVSTVLWRGRMVESEAVVPEAIISRGKSAVIDYVVADILTVSADTGKVAATAAVLKRTGRLGAKECQAQIRPSLAELCGQPELPI